MRKTLTAWSIRWNNRVAKLMKAEDGIGTLEMILIAAVLIIIALLFREWIVALVKKVLASADGQAEKIYSTDT